MTHPATPPHLRTALVVVVVMALALVVSCADGGGSEGGANGRTTTTVRAGDGDADPSEAGAEPPSGDEPAVPDDPLCQAAATRYRLLTEEASGEDAGAARLRALADLFEAVAETATDDALRSEAERASEVAGAAVDDPSSVPTIPDGVEDLIASTCVSEPLAVSVEDGSIELAADSMTAGLGALEVEYGGDTEGLGLGSIKLDRDQTPQEAYAEIREDQTLHRVNGPWAVEPGTSTFIVWNDPGRYALVLGKDAVAEAFAEVTAD